MKSRSINTATLRWLLPALLCPTLYAPMAAAALQIAAVPMAEERVQGPEQRQRPSNGQELPSAAADSQRNSSEAILKCWQNGRLIMDERNWQAPMADTQGPLLRSTAGQFAQLRLFQFGDTFCTLKQGKP